MPGPAAILKEINRLRRLIADLDTRIANAPKQITVQQKKLAAQEETLTKAKEHLKRLALEIREKEGSIKATQTLINKYEKQVDGAANKKEYDTLKSEIAHSKEIISKLEDEILAAMSETDEKTAQLPDVEKTTQKARDDFKQFEKEHQERLARFASDKAQAQADLKTTEDTLPIDVRPQYERLIAAKGNDIISGVTGRTCVACYTEITSQMLNDLKMEAFMLCKNCGRMLYMES
jgi:predicted  nucleic acid-binding Zn-ribbon protein